MSGAADRPLPEVFPSTSSGRLDRDDPTSSLQVSRFVRSELRTHLRGSSRGWRAGSGLRSRVRRSRRWLSPNRSRATRTCSRTLGRVLGTAPCESRRPVAQVAVCGDANTFYSYRSRRSASGRPAPTRCRTSRRCLKLLYTNPVPVSRRSSRVGENLGFFTRQRTEDRSLLLAAILTPFWCVPAGNRPALPVRSGREYRNVAGGHEHGGAEYRRLIGGLVRHRRLGPSPRTDRVCSPRLSRLPGPHAAGAGRAAVSTPKPGPTCCSVLGLSPRHLGNPFRPVTFLPRGERTPRWSLAEQMYYSPRVSPRCRFSLISSDARMYQRRRVEPPAAGRVRTSRVLVCDLVLGKNSTARVVFRRDHPRAHGGEGMSEIEEFREYPFAIDAASCRRNVCCAALPPLRMYVPLVE